jgi:hypothetical protein
VSETKVPAIPSLSGIGDPALRSVLAAMKELIEVRDGRRGHELDQFVKLRDLTEAGVVEYRRNSGSGTRGTISQLNPPDYTTPPALTNLAVTGGYQQMFLSWDYLGPLNYASFSHVEVWRSTTDVLGEATYLGETAAALFSDPCGSAQTFYYWVRAVSKAAVVGPFNAVHGGVGSTAVDVDFLLATLTGQITESQLYQSLGARIDLIDDAGAVTTTVNQRLDTLYAEVENGFVSRDTFNAYKTADEAFAEQVRGMAFVDDTDGRVSALEGVIITQNNDRTNTAIRFDALEAEVDDNTARIAGEETARATADTALTSQLNVALSRIGTTEAAIVSEATTRAGTDSALTSAVNTLSTTVNGNTASIQTQATSIDGLSAQYTVKVDVNGYVSGFGLATTAYNAAPYSSFYVRADRFAIGSPGQAGIVPFVVQTSPIIVNGVEVPVGVYMDAAYLKNGTITTAKIGDAAIDNAKIAALAVGTANIAAAAITEAKIADASIKTAHIQTAAITTALIQDAAITNAQINDLDAVKITAGTLDADRIGADSITADKINVASLDAVSAVIGVLRTATTGARLEIRDNVIKVYDSNNVVRVQVGNLAL